MTGPYTWRSHMQTHGQSHGGRQLLSVTVPCCSIIWKDTSSPPWQPPPGPLHGVGTRRARERVWWGCKCSGERSDMGGLSSGVGHRQMLWLMLLDTEELDTRTVPPLPFMSWWLWNQPLSSQAETRPPSSIHLWHKETEWRHLWVSCCFLEDSPGQWHLQRKVQCAHSYLNDMGYLHMEHSWEFVNGDDVCRRSSGS